MAYEIEIKNNKIKAPLKGEDVWLVLKPEEEVRQKYISRLINDYGYSIAQMAQDFFSSQKQVKHLIKYDIVVWKSVEQKKEKKNPLIIIECKSDSIIIRSDDYFKGINLSNTLNADFFVATNSKQTKIFSKVFKVGSSNEVDELLNIPTAHQAIVDNEVDKLKKQTIEFTREDFSKVLLRCHNIIRNNDKLSPEAAFDEISKVLFIKIRYERDNKEGQIFTEKIYKENKLRLNQLNEEIGEKKVLPLYQNLFERTKEQFKDDDLFEANEIIRIRENSFEAIVKELEIYNLSTTSDDVKGIAFEEFLGKTFRGELGQFFTPRTLVDFMVEVLDPQEGEVICDPCCGSGGFLIKAFEYVRSKIENEIHLAKEKIKEEYYTVAYEKMKEKDKEKVDEIVNDLFAKLNLELDINHPRSRVRELSYDCIFGTDANPRMSRTAKMNMIMHGDGHGGVHHNDGLLNVNGIFENRFDIILTNPPFGARVEKSLKITEADKYKDADRIRKYRDKYGPAYDKALRQINDNIGKSLLSLYDTGSMSTLTEVLFIERCLRLLKPGGRMGIVLPEGVLNNSNLQSVRDYVEGKAIILLITSIPQDVFVKSGATVKPSILFFKKFTDDEAKQYRVIVEKTQKEIGKKYAAPLKKINDQLALKGKDALSVEDKKKLRAELKSIEQTMEAELKAQVKAAFNYTVPIAEVEKAGISTTGAVIDNELKPLAMEYTAYRQEKNLWQDKYKEIGYTLVEDDILRTGIVEEPEEFYNN